MHTCPLLTLGTRTSRGEGTYEEYESTDELPTSLRLTARRASLAHFRFHPANLPERSTLPPTSEVRIKQ